MAGSSVTITFSKIDSPYAENRGIVKVLIAWVADDATGAVPDTAFDTDDMLDIMGRYCVLGTTNPGVTAPTANYDISIEDAQGIDVFGGELGNRSASASEQAEPKMGNGYGPRVIADNLTFKLTNNSVNSALGECALYFKD